ncbi:PDZ domain-containing protein [Danxiaibacter flavus]|uniref:PDZ domain-containing protein n=1 Tax=Danxiaibacter flavus TaxID=3049108 RepID=A0ABV3ZMA4_9BACT|nr:PDZ domain-containing protein [Chitinophagaceae bacterium DXS]
MKKLIAFLACLPFLVTAYAQQFRYDLSFPNLRHHEAQISLTAISVKKGQPAIFRMSRSSPGRYATHEFGKNVYNVKAFGRDGKQIEINKTDGDVYEVPDHDGWIKVEYTLFANYADGTYACVDENTVHLNMPATLMWMKGMDKDSALIQVHFSVPAGKQWKVATQLKPTDEPFTFTAPGFQYLMDSPAKLGDLKFAGWTIQNKNGAQYKFRLALEANADQQQTDAFGEKVKRITQEAQAVFGETPAYDFGTYTFIASMNPYVHGDGMEHRNSTMITSGGAFTGANNQLGVFSHEFFHCWNVERIRPKTLEPFNFEKSNMSNELWLAEGFTQYFGDLILKRCDFTALNDWANTMAYYINEKENTPGGTLYSPVDNSRTAVFRDAGVSIDRTNYPNMFTSYYTYGAAIALALDIELRTKFNLSLDDFMRAMWKSYGKTEHPYTLQDVRKTLQQLTQNDQFAKTFYEKYITGHESFDYATGLAKLGLNVHVDGTPWIGRLSLRDDKPIITNTVVKNTPLYDAGLDIDDEIVTLDNNAIKKLDDVKKIINSHKPGDVISIVYKHREQEQTSTIKIAASPLISLSVSDDSGTTAVRDKWLGSAVK